MNLKKRITFFFKNIFLDIIKKLENTYSSEDIILDNYKINKKIEEAFSLTNNNNNKINNINKVKIKFKEKIDLIIANYIQKEVNIDKLNKKLLEYKDKEMKDFIQKKISEIESNSENTFSNKLFLNNFFSAKNSGEILNYYNSSFLQAIGIIDIFLDNSLNP